ncbi:VOC family protein [Deinococcus sp.]|uniref:VOC family protein n=1 Tax=Deinococcus sp. TaxID=47478 RepID=UPI003CC5AFCF
MTGEGSPLISGLDHVQIEAPPGHEDEARHFYGGFLGLPELPKPDVLLPNGGVWFALPDGRHLHTGVVADFAPRTKGHPCLRCPDLDAVLKRAAEFGVEIQQDFQLAPLRRAFLHDPFGNRLEIVEERHER